MRSREKYTPEQVIAALQDAKGLVFLAAHKLGCGRQTIARYQKRYPAVREAVVTAKGGMCDLAESKLYDAIESGAPWAICFYLKTQAKDRGYVERQEVAETDAKGKSKTRPSLSPKNLTRIREEVYGFTNGESKE